MAEWMDMGLTRAAAVGLLRACHPEPTVAVTVIAALLAVATGRAIPGVLAVAGAVLAGQLSVGWLNDYLDSSRDRVAGRAGKPLANGTVGRRLVAAATALAAAACVPLSLASGPLAGGLHLVAVGSAYSYNLGLKSTPVSVLPYLVSFGLLPVFVVLGQPGAMLRWWLPVAGALLGGGAHFANVLPDLATDAATGVRGLPHRLGAAGSRWHAALLLLAATLVLIIGPPLPLPVAIAAIVLATVVLSSGLWRGARLESRAAFRAVMIVAALDAVLLLTAGTTVW